MTTEQKALELADRLQQDFHSEYINWDNVIEAAAEINRLSAENEALRARVEALTRDTERQASKIAELAAELAGCEARHRVDRARLQTIQEHRLKECWYWQGDGQDHLESLVGSLPVVIRADQLRELLADGRAQVEALSKELTAANNSTAWHKRRTSLLQSLQSTMQEPERTIVCDVLANGHLLQGPDGQPDKQRYVVPAPTRPAEAESDTRTQHDADSRELRSLCIARDEARRQRDMLTVENAALQSSIGHLSRAIDEQRQLLIEVEKECGTDNYGMQYEDGDSKIIDRVRSHLGMLAAAPQAEASSVCVSNSRESETQANLSAGQLTLAPQAEVQTPGDWVRNNVSGRGELVEALARQADAQGIDRCTSCDGTGDLIDMTGEWLGYCVCEEGRALKAQKGGAR